MKKEVAIVCCSRVLMLEKHQALTALLPSRQLLSMYEIATVPGSPEYRNVTPRY